MCLHFIVASRYLQKLKYSFLLYPLFVSLWVKFTRQKQKNIMGEHINFGLIHICLQILALALINGMTFIELLNLSYLQFFYLPVELVIPFSWTCQKNQFDSLSTVPAHNRHLGHEIIIIVRKETSGEFA